MPSLWDLNLAQCPYITDDGFIAWCQQGMYILSLILPSRVLVEMMQITACCHRLISVVPSCESRCYASEVLYSLTPSFPLPHR